ncbi:MAG: ATP-binding cassette domain-containing protein [Actinomycetota bacterium]
MLRAEDIEVRYGAVAAVRGVSLQVGDGEVVALLGPNGAGKTSLLRAVSGLVRHSGRVSVDDVAYQKPDRAFGSGIVHVPQGRGLFRRLSVAQNISLGAAGKRVGSVALAVQRIPELETWWRRRVGSLSGGEQVLVALGRLIAGRPRFALVDELSLGLAPIARDRVDDELRRLRADGVGIVVVDQHAPRALDLADRVIVLERGSVVISSRADKVSSDRIAGLATGVSR